jgi:hypothetical protein
MVRFEPYVAILGGSSEGYVVVCQSEYVGFKRKIERGMEREPAEKPSPTRDYVIIRFNKAGAVHLRVPRLGQLFDVLSCRSWNEHRWPEGMTDRMYGGVDTPRSAGGIKLDHGSTSEAPRL